jgi:hypothetical protein
MNGSRRMRENGGENALTPGTEKNLKKLVGP